MTNERGASIECATPAEAVDNLQAIYDESRIALRDAFNAFVEKGAVPSVEDRRAGRFSYPRLVVTYSPKGAIPAFSRAFGNFNGPGVYQTDIAQPQPLSRIPHQPARNADQCLRLSASRLPGQILRFRILTF